jgi:hypothetical protein
MAIAGTSSSPSSRSRSTNDQAFAATPKLHKIPERWYHACYRIGDDGFAIFDVWDPEASFAHFAEILGPVLEKVGLTFVAPNIYPIHNTAPLAGAIGPRFGVSRPGPAA